MAIFDKNDRLLQYRYKVKTVQIIIPNENPLNIPKERLTQIDIENLYEENYFPFFHIKLVLDAEDYYKIQQHKNECKINLRIDKFYTDDTRHETSLDRIFINDSFDLILDSNTEDLLNSLKQDESKADYKNMKTKNSDQLSAKNNNAIDFYLFKSSINGTKTNVNKVLTNVNISDAIAYVLGNGGFKNVLMGQPDNTKIYKEFLIPPLSILKTLAFFDTYYGIYKTGSMIWFDFNYTYIIPYSGKCVAYAANELQNTSIIVPKSTNYDHSGSLGTLNKPNNTDTHFIVADYQTLTISNKSISNDFLKTNTMQTVDSYSETTTTTKSTAKSKNTNFVQIFSNKTENSFISDMYAAQSNANSDVVSIRLNDYDIAAISPNKRFQLIFEDSKYTKKYNGNYILAGITHSFLNEGSDFLLSSVIVLRKE